MQKRLQWTRNHCRRFFTFPHIGVLFLFSPSFVQNVLYHFFYLHSHIHEIPVKNAFPFLPRLERVELRQRYIRCFLLLDFLHVEIRFAEELRGLELLRFLYVHRTAYTGFCLDEVPCRLTAYPARRHIRGFRGGHEAVHVLVQVDTRFVPVRDNVFFQPHYHARHTRAGQAVALRNWMIGCYIVEYEQNDSEFMRQCRIKCRKLTVLLLIRNM